MNLAKKQKDFNKKGATLVYVILLLCFASVLGVGALYLSENSMKYTAKEITSEQAFLTAKSALNYIVDVFTKDDHTTEIDQISAALATNSPDSADNLMTGDLSSVDPQLGSFEAKFTCDSKSSDGKRCEMIKLQVTGYYQNSQATLGATLNYDKSKKGSGFEAPYVFGGNISTGNKNVYWFDFTEEELNREHCEFDSNGKPLWCRGVNATLAQDEQHQQQKVDTSHLFEADNINLKSTVITSIKTFINTNTINSVPQRKFETVYNDFNTFNVSLEPFDQALINHNNLLPLINQFISIIPSCKYWCDLKNIPGSMGNHIKESTRSIKDYPENSSIATNISSIGNYETNTKGNKQSGYLGDLKKIVDEILVFKNTAEYNKEQNKIITDNLANAINGQKAEMESVKKVLNYVETNYCKTGIKNNCVYNANSTMYLGNDIANDYFIFIPADKNKVLNLDKLQLYFSNDNEAKGNSITIVTDAKEIHITENTIIKTAVFQFNHKSDGTYTSNQANDRECTNATGGVIDYGECFVKLSNYGSEYRVSLINLYNGPSDIYISGTVKRGDNVLSTSTWILSPNAKVHHGYKLVNGKREPAPTNRYSGGIFAKDIDVHEDSVILGIGHHFKESTNAGASFASDLYKLLGAIGISMTDGSGGADESLWGATYD